MRSCLELTRLSLEGDVLPRFADWAEHQCDKLILAKLEEVERDLSRELEGAWSVRPTLGELSTPARQVDPTKDGSLIDLLGHCRQIHRYYQAVCDNPNNKTRLAFLRQPTRQFRR
ncbi:hypothetical protein [Marinimicrobium sp. LS-A18]|uniref:hypothetical protein n=1 Tax=Marinimicrobium sp. LS-A18 TaxID=1381596 RepID=UPI001EE6D553|nr:hypothetical protein [Marinimicrobium sp. LS-A18]